MIFNGIIFVAQYLFNSIINTIMKVSIRIVLNVCLLSAIFFSCSHDDEVIPTPKDCAELKAQGIIDSFPYPIRPGSEAWKNLKTTTEMYEAVSVPTDILKEMCTHGLVYTCVYCPIFIPDLNVCVCPRDCFLYLCDHLNSFGELIQREDAGIELFDYYTLLTDTTLNNIKPVEYYMQIFSVEIFFAQQEFLSQFNNDLLNEVLLKAYDNLLIKEKLIISTTPYIGNLYLTANILYYNIKYQPLIDFIDNYETLDIFYIPDMWNEEVIDTLRYYTEEYIIKNL
jgi:hypothetical protein